MEFDQASIKLSMQRYLTLANELRPDRLTKANFNVFQGPTLYASSPELLELQQAIVLSGEWFVIAGARAYCDAFVDTPSPPLSAYLVGFGPPGVTLLCEPPAETALPKGFLLGGTRNYFHWLIDTLPRLEFYRSDCGPLFVNASLQPFQTQSLELLGLADVDLIPLEYPRAYAVGPGGRRPDPTRISASLQSAEAFLPAHCIHRLHATINLSTRHTSMAAQTIQRVPQPRQRMAEAFHFSCWVPASDRPPATQRGGTYHPCLPTRFSGRAVRGTVVAGAGHAVLGGRHHRRRARRRTYQHDICARGNNNHRDDWTTL
jgi:hypothetical protein